MSWEKRSEIVKEWKESGQSMRVWCQEKGIAYTTFLHWKKTVGMKEQEGKRNQKTQWAEVVSKPEKKQTSKSTIRIRRGDWIINVKSGVNKELLVDVLKAV